MAPSIPLLFGLYVIASNIPLAAAADPKVVSIPFSEQTYGPDGPWYAVKARVGGNAQVTTATTNVDLLPGGQFSSYIPTQRSCQAFPDQDSCGKGGMWSPDSNATPFTVAWNPPLQDKEFGLNGTGTILPQAMTLGEPPITVPNVTLASLTTASITDARSQKKYGLSLGFLSLGGDQEQVFTRGSAPPYRAWIYPGYLYNKSITASFSYSLHSGSAPLKYPGSLTFGGYNKKRMVGPYLTWGTAKDPLLKSISAGVEVGGWPFKNGSSYTDLLQDGDSSAKSVSVNIEPTIPYMVLPAKTCSAIASLLPVSFDPDTEFYLWDTSSDLYKSLIGSPAYLAFTFAPPSNNGSVLPANSGDDITIKVPFSVLNLTLTAPLSATSKPYFPCRPFSNGVSTGYRLGRAFLQSAVLSRNYNKNLYFLSQAIGPYGNRDGGGSEMVVMKSGDTTLDIPVDKKLFSASWADLWAALPGEHATNNPEAVKPRGSGNPNNLAGLIGGSEGLSTGAKAGIGAGVGVAVLALAGIGFFLMRKYKKKDHRGAYTGAPSADDVPPYHGQYKQQPQPMYGASPALSHVHPAPVPGNGAPTGYYPNQDYNTAHKGYYGAGAAPYANPPQELHQGETRYEMDSLPVHKAGVGAGTGPATTAHAAVELPAENAGASNRYSELPADTAHVVSPPSQAATPVQNGAPSSAVSPPSHR